jgi:hypothetical protein
MAKNLFTDTKDKAGFYGFNPTGYVQSSLDNGAGQKDFSPTATNVIPPDASKGKTVSLITPDTDGIDYLSQLLTTPEQEAEYRKDNINAQKIALIGDALRQVGNVITTSKGAVPQQFSASPVAGLAAEYKADKAKRDANNLRYYTAKQQERIAEAKNALAQQEMQYKRAMDAFNIQYKLAEAKRAQEEKERERKHKSEEAQKGREFTAKENELDRATSTKNAYIRKSNGGSDGAGSGRYMMSPDGIWSRKTSLDSNELESAKAMLIKNGYTLPIDPMYSAAYLAAKQNNNFQEMQVLKSIGEEKTRDAIMQIMSQDANAAKLIGERFGFTFMPSSNTTTNNNNNNANANTSSGGIVLPTPKWQHGNTESGKDENGKADLRDLLGTKG